MEGLGLRRRRGPGPQPSCASWALGSGPAQVAALCFLPASGTAPLVVKADASQRPCVQRLSVKPSSCQPVPSAFGETLSRSLYHFASSTISPPGWEGCMLVAIKPVGVLKFQVPPHLVKAHLKGTRSKEQAVIQHSCKW